MSNKLPTKFLDINNVEHLPIGEVAYIVPWAVQIAVDGNAYIRKDASINKRAGGTVSLKIERTKRGLKMYPIYGRHTFKPQEVDIRNLQGEIVMEQFIEIEE